jgi:hypothetical protein
MKKKMLFVRGTCVKVKSNCSSYLSRCESVSHMGTVGIGCVMICVTT